MFRVASRFMGLGAVVLVLVCLALHVRGNLEPAPATETVETQIPEQVEPKIEEERERDVAERMRIHIREIRNAEPQPKPEVQSTPPVSRPNITPSDALVSSGMAAMADLGEQGVPRIAADYSLHLGFDQYARAMVERGARFAVLRRGTNRLLWIDLASRSLVSDGSGMAGMSTLTRRISNEPALGWAKQKARAEGPGAYDTVLIMPARMEAYLMGGLQKVAKAEGFPLAAYRSFRGVYKIERGRLVLNVTSGELKGGRVVSLDKTLAL